MITKTSVVERFIVNEIENGNFSVGSKIPSRSALGKRFRCSRTVVEKAMDNLKKSGYVAGSKGSGTYVIADHIQSGKIKHLKILSDFNITAENISCLPDFNFDDLNIAVEWIPLERAAVNFEKLCEIGTAVIAMRPGISQIFMLERLRKRNIPVLLLNRDYDGFDYIMTDPHASIREGVSWLLIEGGRDIAFVSHRPTVKRPYIAERILSFYESAIELGAHLNSEWCISKNIDSFTEDIADIGRRLFGAPRHPGGIFILDIDLVLPVVNCGQGYGFTPGRDYKLLTFDNIPELEKRPGIAMMKQPDLLYEREIRRWLNSVYNNRPFKSSLKTELNVSPEDI
ncbi:MAG: GntR family transcriptional regulator [Lentisphaeria bacterium]|nr:GntR family transcriptional regulator [Lentisphaeria bacterium]